MKQFEKELVFWRSEQARLKLKDLAGILKKSPQRLKYHIRQLEREKQLYNPHSIIDYSFFGLHLFRVYFKTGYVGEKDKTPILQQLTNHPYIVAVYELSGEFDLVLEMEAPNASRFNKELKKLISQLPTLNNYKIVLNIVTHLYPKWYLLANVNAEQARVDNDLIIGGDRGWEEFSKEELALLHRLVVTPLGRFTSLARQAGINVKTAMSLMKSLQQRRIIKGFRFILDNNQLGINHYRLFLKLHNLTQERETALMDFLLNRPEAIQLHKTVGDWDMEIDLESLDKTAIRLVMVNLREEFADLIETWNNMEFYCYYKKAFLPEALFQTSQGEKPVSDVKS